MPLIACVMKLCCAHAGFNVNSFCFSRFHHCFPHAFTVSLNCRFISMVRGNCQRLSIPMNKWLSVLNFEKQMPQWGHNLLFDIFAIVILRANTDYFCAISFDKHVRSHLTKSKWKASLVTLPFEHFYHGESKLESAFDCPTATFHIKWQKNVYVFDSGLFPSNVGLCLARIGTKINKLPFEMCKLNSSISLARSLMPTNIASKCSQLKYLT